MKTNTCKKPQNELWSKLTNEQRREAAKVFGHLKKKSQAKLSCWLLDYIEKSCLPVFDDEDIMIAACFFQLTGLASSKKESWNIIPDRVKHNSSINFKTFLL